MAKKESVQKRLQKVRPPRVQLTYDVEIGDAIVHTLSWQMARHFHVPVRGAFVDPAGDPNQAKQGRPAGTTGRSRPNSAAHISIGQHSVDASIVSAMYWYSSAILPLDQ